MYETTELYVSGARRGHGVATSLMQGLIRFTCTSKSSRSQDHLRHMQCDFLLLIHCRNYGIYRIF